VTIPARQRPAAPAPGHALQVIRAGYGLALILVPGPLIRLATGRPPGRRTCWTARVLGTRHLVQTALTAAAPQPAVFAVGAQVDTLHATSMLLLAAVSQDGRRAALADALTEAAFAATGFSVTGFSVTGFSASIYC